MLRMPNSVDDIIKKYCSGELVFQPGIGFSYNNTDYRNINELINRKYFSKFNLLVCKQDYK